MAKCKYDTVKCVIQYFDAASFMSFKFVADYWYYHHDIINKFYYAWNYFVMCHKDFILCIAEFVHEYMQNIYALTDS